MACFSAQLSSAQTRIPIAPDADSLYRLIIQSYAYKDQIKDVQAQEYTKVYQSIRQKALPATADLERLQLLSQLLAPIKDNHFSLLTIGAPRFNIQKFQDLGYIKEFKDQAFFKEFPRVKDDLRTLAARLGKSDSASIEGIYYSPDREVKMGLFRTAVQDSLVGVILESSLPHWEPGMIALILKQRAPRRFFAWYADVRNMNFHYYPAERFQNFTLKISNWKKYPDKRERIILVSQEPFELKALSPGVQYLRLGTFMATDKAMAISQKFYDP